MKEIGLLAEGTAAGTTAHINVLGMLLEGGHKNFILDEIFKVV